MGMLTSPLTGLSEDLQRLQKEVLEGLEPPDEDDEKEDVRDELQEGLAAIEELVASSWQSSEDFRASRPATGGPAVLSENTVLVVSGEDCVEDVRHLVFRFQRLQSLTAQGSVDLNRLQGLEVLSLSHNQLRDLQPLSALVSLSEVNLNFNQIEDLSPLFDCLQLTKVFAAHNRVSSIAGLENCQQLQELSLFANSLSEGDSEELVTTLSQLPQLQSLDLAENGLCLGAQLQGLSQLQVLDGEELGRPKTGHTTSVFSGGNCLMSPSRPSEASLGDADARSPQRPGTAPSAKPPKPPKLPPEGGGYPSAVLPGGALRPAQSNRMDELLTKSEVQTPDSPKQMLKVLALHGEALKRQLETQLAERENLRFQVRLLERDVREREPSFIEKQIAQLEAENHSKVAVLEEFGRLTARRSQLQSALADMEGAQVQSPALAALEASSFLAASNEVDDEDLDMARWECRRLEKRLAQARSYNCELLQDLERKPAMSTNASEETEVAALVAQNEEMLSRLRSKLRTAQGTQVSPPKVPKAPPPKGRRGGADVVEVLTIGAGPEGQDLEWQTTRAPARKP